MAPHVTLKGSKGSPERGAGPGGSYWHVYADGKRVGAVFINVTSEAPYGQHASIQIFLNKASQGRGIGSVAYRLACEQSGHDVVYAHMSRSNVASRKAAKHAGFTEARGQSGRQLTMVWRR